MSNRPSLARKVTPKDKAKTQEALDQGVKFTLPTGETYEVRIGDVTPRLAREVRRETGSSFQHILREAGADSDIDTISTLVWIARRVKGEEVELDDVEVGYDVLLSDGFAVEEAGPEEVTASPEA